MHDFVIMFITNQIYLLIAPVFEMPGVSLILFIMAVQVKFTTSIRFC